MGIQVDTQAMSCHAFRSQRRRLAIESKSVEIQRMRQRVEQVERELEAWWTWWKWQIKLTEWYGVLAEFGAAPPDELRGFQDSAKRQVTRLEESATNDKIDKDHVKNDKINEESMKNDKIKEESVMIEKSIKEGMKNDKTGEESVKNDKIDEESVKNDKINEESVNNHRINEESVMIEKTNEEGANQDDFDMASDLGSEPVDEDDALQYWQHVGYAPGCFWRLLTDGLKKFPADSQPIHESERNRLFHSVVGTTMMKLRRARGAREEQALEQLCANCTMKVVHQFLRKQRIVDLLHHDWKACRQLLVDSVLEFMVEAAPEVAPT